MKDMLASLPQLREAKEKVRPRVKAAAAGGGKLTGVDVAALPALDDGGEVHGAVRVEEAAALGISRAGASLRVRPIKCTRDRKSVV